MELLWPGVFVAEGNLARLVAELREAMADDAGAPRYLRTVQRFGYAFHGEARADPDGLARSIAPPSFVLRWAESEIALSGGENVLGRDPASTICIDDVSVSRYHARIVIDGSAARLEDLGSKNGTYLRGQKLEAATPLRDGDPIRLGSVALVFHRSETSNATETESLS